MAGADFLARALRASGPAAGPVPGADGVLARATGVLDFGAAALAGATRADFGPGGFAFSGAFACAAERFPFGASALALPGAAFADGAFAGGAFAGGAFVGAAFAGGVFAGAAFDCAADGLAGVFPAFAGFIAGADAFASG